MKMSLKTKLNTISKKLPSTKLLFAISTAIIIAAIMYISILLITFK